MKPVSEAQQQLQQLMNYRDKLVADKASYESRLKELRGQLGDKLPEVRTQDRLTGRIAVKIRYSDGETHTEQRSIPFCNRDHQLIAIAKELFRKLFSRRVWVRLIGIRYMNLIPGVYQIDLFEDNQETIKLYQSIDHIKKRFGETLLKRVVTVAGEQ